MYKGKWGSIKLNIYNEYRSRCLAKEAMFEVEKLRPQWAGKSEEARVHAQERENSAIPILDYIDLRLT